MQDCTELLFDHLKKRYPFVPPDTVEADPSQRFHSAQGAFKTLSPELQRELYDLIDDMETLSHFQAHHAFLLGLDLGLSLARELQPLQKGL